MRLRFQDPAKTLHRNVLLVCAAGAVVAGGAHFIFEGLLGDIETARLEGRLKGELLRAADARAWLQVLLVTSLLYTCAALCSFFSLCASP